MTKIEWKYKFKRLTDCNKNLVFIWHCIENRCVWVSEWVNTGERRWEIKTLFRAVFNSDKLTWDKLKDKKTCLTLICCSDPERTKPDYHIRKHLHAIISHSAWAQTVEVYSHRSLSQALLFFAHSLYPQDHFRSQRAVFLRLQTQWDVMNFQNTQHQYLCNLFIYSVSDKMFHQFVLEK